MEAVETTPFEGLTPLKVTESFGRSLDAFESSFQSQQGVELCGVEYKGKEGPERVGFSDNIRIHKMPYNNGGETYSIEHKEAHSFSRSALIGESLHRN